MSADNVLQLEQPLKAGGISTANFFNGRLLTSKDLTREQAARRESDWRLGLACGDGVAFGFEVDRDTAQSKERAPVLRIASGVAVNRKGQVLRLTADTSVALTRRFSATSEDCIFADCDPIAGGTYIGGAGVYVLTVAPAEKTEGRAASNGLDPTNVRCNTDATLETLRFRLHTVEYDEYGSLGIGSSSFRNALAYRCFGDGVQAGWLQSLLTAQARDDGLLESVRDTSLTDYDVPLALIYITGAANIEFIDVWSVRRPLSRTSADLWSSLVDERRGAVGYAMFLQFQRQLLESAKPSGDLRPLTAQSHFKYLPPAGVIPVPAEKDGSDAEATRFFGGMTYCGPAFVNGARVEALLRESLSYPAIDTASGELIWLYRVRENRMAIDFASATPTPRSYVVFTTGHMPYRGDAQFDLAYWNYSNYAL